MNISPFCCDITSGTPEEQQEFKRLFLKASEEDYWSFIPNYYGYDKGYKWGYDYSEIIASRDFSRIIPLSEGIAILKEYVGEESKPKVSAQYTESDIDLAYLAGVFNASGIDGLYNEIQRLKSLGKNPHDIIIEGRNQPKP